MNNQYLIKALINRGKNIIGNITEYTQLTSTEQNAIFELTRRMKTLGLRTIQNDRYNIILTGFKSEYEKELNRVVKEQKQNA